jgi:hypothetical protein
LSPPATRESCWKERLRRSARLRSRLLWKFIVGSPFESGPDCCLVVVVARRNARGGAATLKARTLAVAVDRRFKKSGGPGNLPALMKDQSGCRLDRIQGRPNDCLQRENSIPMRLQQEARGQKSRSRPPRNAEHKSVATRSRAARNRPANKSFGRRAARCGSERRRLAEIFRGADFRGDRTLRRPRGANRPWKDLPRPFH